MNRDVAMRAGDVVAERYQVEGPLGEGGMSVVYRARHLVTGKACALKFLQPALLKRTGLTEQFLKEARVAGRIGSHPNIVEIFDAAMDAARGVPFLAMELLKGETLAEFVARRGALPHAEAIDILEQVADALDAAHQAGVVHRDLKLTNVFVVQTSRRALVKVLDFGIAKILEGISAATATQVGTPAYCAPEQLGASVRTLAAERGIAIATGVSPATDVWALGFVAWSLFSGLSAEEYWGVNTFGDLLVRMALEKHAAPSERAGARAKDLPVGFDGWFERCTKHDALQRFKAPGEAVLELRQLSCEEETLRATPPPKQAASPLAFDRDEVTKVLPSRRQPSLPPTEQLPPSPAVVPPPTPLQHVLPAPRSSLPDPPFLWSHLARWRTLQRGAKVAFAAGATAIAVMLVGGVLAAESAGNQAIAAERNLSAFVGSVVWPTSEPEEEEQPKHAKARPVESAKPRAAPSPSPGHRAPDSDEPAKSPEEQFEEQFDTR